MRWMGALDGCQSHIQKCVRIEPAGRDRSAGARHLIWDRVKDGPVDELLPLASEQKDFRNQGVRKEEALCTGSVDDRRHRWEQACLLGFEQDV